MTAAAICCSAEGTCAARLVAAARAIQPAREGALIVVLTLLGKRNLEPVRVGEHENPGAPRHIGRLLIQHDATRFGASRKPIEILSGVEPQPHADPLHPVAAFLEVILGENQLGVARTKLYAGKLAFFFPPLVDYESQPSV